MISNELSTTIAVSMKKHDIPNHFKVTAFRGGAVISVGGVKFAVCMLGERLPKLNDLEKILGKRDSHYPADAVGYIKQLKWMPGGSQGMANVSIKKNPGKVRATRCRVIRCRVIRCRALTRVTLLSTSRFLQALVKIDGKVKEYLIGPAVEDEFLLFGTPTFELELGAVDGGDVMQPDCDFDNAKHAWSEWFSGEMNDDVEKMKSAALFLVSKDGDPKTCSSGYGGIKAF